MIKPDKYQILIIFLLLLLAPFNMVFCQTTVKSQDKVVVSTEQTNIKVEPVPINKIEDFKKDNAFKYSKLESGIDIWAIIWYWLLKILRAIFSNEGAAPYIRYFVFAILLGLVLVRIFRGDLFGIFSMNKSMNNMNGFEYFEENIHQIDLDKKIAEEINAGNFRNAIRYYYLKLLKSLDNKEIIQWEAGKTNRDYQKELKNHTVLNDFINLSGIFEFTWYGNFDINKSNFKNWQENFNRTFNQIN